MPVATQPVIDGRRARRERGRLAVTDAMIDLVFEGNIPPTSEQIAERAGVSVASIFRYFDTLDDLRRATTDVYLERFAHIFEIPEIGEGSPATRIDTFVSSRVTTHETTEPMARLVRSRALDNSEIDAALQGVRATRAEQIRHHFAHEIGRLTPAAADDLVAVIATLTSFESWDQARHEHRRSASQLRRAWNGALTRLLADG
jgi:AcrR family transcriptional regulator